MDAIANKDIATAAALLERYHIPADGIIERVVARCMGYGGFVRADEEPTMMLGDE